MLVIDMKAGVEKKEVHYIEVHPGVPKDVEKVWVEVVLDVLESDYGISGVFDDEQERFYFRDKYAVDVAKDVIKRYASAIYTMDALVRIYRKCKETNSAEIETAEIETNDIEFTRRMLEGTYMPDDLGIEKIEF